MTVEVRLRPQGEEDLEDAATWYESQRPGLGQQFLDEVLTALSTIAEMPLGDGVIVIAIIHGSRHPRRWQGRA